MSDRDALTEAVFDMLLDNDLTNEDVLIILGTVLAEFLCDAPEQWRVWLLDRIYSGLMQVLRDESDVPAAALNS